MSMEFIVLFLKKAFNASDDMRKKALFAFIGFILLLLLTVYLQPENKILSESQKAVNDVNSATEAAKDAIKEIKPPSLKETKKTVEKEIKNVQDDVLNPSMD